MNPDALTETFVRTEIRTLLRGLIHEERRLEKITLVSDDDDDVTDAVNDLASVRLLLNRLRKAAIEKYGPSVAEFHFAAEKA